MESFTGVIALDRLSKQIDRHQILKNISLEFSEGESVLLVGANGAGKSTLLKICAGIVRPTSGAVNFRGLSHPPSTQIGYVGHQSMLYPALTVEENLRFFADLLKVESAQVTQLIERWKLHDQRRKFPEQLSKGLLARVALARAFCGNPRFLFLDEPTAALDQASVTILLSELEALRRFHDQKMITVVITHDIARLSDFAQRVVVLDNGSLLLDSQVRSAQQQDLTVQRSLEIYLQHNR